MGRRKVAVAVILAAIIVLGGVGVKRYMDRKAAARQALQFQVEEPAFNFEQNVRTNDRLFWNGEEYRIDHSPLSVFGGYKEVFGEHSGKMGDAKGDSVLPDDRQGENCHAEWVIVGDSLYLAEVVFDGATGEPVDYTKLEQMTGVSFLPVPVGRQEMSETERMMPARWVSGPFYVKGSVRSTSGVHAQDQEDRLKEDQGVLYKITFEAGGISKIEKTRKMSPH